MPPDARQVSSQSFRLQLSARSGPVARSSWECPTPQVAERSSTPRPSSAAPASSLCWPTKLDVAAEPTRCGRRRGEGGGRCRSKILTPSAVAARGSGPAWPPRLCLRRVRCSVSLHECDSRAFNSNHCYQDLFGIASGSICSELQLWLIVKSTHQ